MKILYSISSLKQGGGTERVLTTKANWLARNGHEVLILTDSGPESPFFELSPEVKVMNLGADSAKTHLRKVREIARDFRPDACVAVSGFAITTLPRLGDASLKVLEFHYTRNFLVNFVRGIHKIRFRSLHLLKMRWLQWRLGRNARRFDRFVGLTARDVGLWNNPRNMTFIYNPLSFRSALKSDCSAKTVIAVGSWTPAKGMDRLLEAFGPLSKEFPDWKVKLFGSGQDEALLRGIIARHGMEEAVTLHAPVADIGSELRAASIYAFPSRSDGFGLVITEAMECGLPTVAMDCPCGPGEILTPQTGIVVPDGDTDAFRNALRRLMADPDLRLTMGKQAAKEVERFYPEHIMPRWTELFEQRQ